MNQEKDYCDYRRKSVRLHLQVTLLNRSALSLLLLFFLRLPSAPLCIPFPSGNSDDVGMMAWQ
jgi:hypothetical protein